MVWIEAMASHSKELEDYWNEFKIIEQANIHSYEDEIFKAPDGEYGNLTSIFALIHLL